MDKPTYRQIANYLANELGVDRNAVEDIVRRMVDRRNLDEIVKQRLNKYFGFPAEAGDARTYIEARVDELVADRLEKEIDDQVRFRIQAAARNYARAIVSPGPGPECEPPATQTDPTLGPDGCVAGLTRDGCIGRKPVRDGIPETVQDMFGGYAEAIWAAAGGKVMDAMERTKDPDDVRGAVADVLLAALAGRPANKYSLSDMLDLHGIGPDDRMHLRYRTGTGWDRRVAATPSMVRRERDADTLAVSAVRPRFDARMRFQGFEFDVSDASDVAGPNRAAVSVETPFGMLSASPSGDPANPGIEVGLLAGDGEIRPVALIEATSDEADVDRTCLVTRTWDDVRAPEYGTRVVHSGIPDR